MKQLIKQLHQPVDAFVVWCVVMIYGQEFSSGSRRNRRIIFWEAGFQYINRRVVPQVLPESTDTAVYSVDYFL